MFYLSNLRERFCCTNTLDTGLGRDMTFRGPFGRKQVKCAGMPTRAQNSTYLEILLLSELPLCKGEFVIYLIVVFNLMANLNKTL